MLHKETYCMVAQLKVVHQRSSFKSMSDGTSYPRLFHLFSSSPQMKFKCPRPGNGAGLKRSCTMVKRASSEQETDCVLDNIGMPQSKMCTSTLLFQEHVRRHFLSKIVSSFFIITRTKLDSKGIVVNPCQRSQCQSRNGANTSTTKEYFLF